MARPGRRYYEQAAARELLVFRICEYLRSDDCRQCPATIEVQGEEGRPLCRGLAEEAIAVVLEDFAERAPGHVRQDN